MTESQITQKIKTLRSELNGAIHDATSLGLRVEVNVIETRTIEPKHSRPIIDIQISKEL